MITNSVYPQEDNALAEEIIALEKAALERWNRGDIWGYLDLYADDIVYFDPMLEKRMDGKEKITEYYSPWEGNIHITESEMINPKVQAVENMAVLTFNLHSADGEHVYRWNCTEVYRNDNNRWRIIQTHWSSIQPEI